MRASTAPGDRTAADRERVVACGDADTQARELPADGLGPVALLVREPRDAAEDARALAVAGEGRERGQEDAGSFFRKGVAGDWRAAFTDRDKRIFKEEAGDLLVALGYEKDTGW